MQFLDNIKHKYGEYKLSKIKRKNSVVSLGFNQIKSFGILYEAADKSSIDFIKKVTGKLESLNKTVNTLAYVDMSDLQDYHIQPKKFSFYSNSNLNWYSKPDFFEIKDFIDTEYDVLLDLNFNRHLPQLFILKSINANLKVGSKQEFNHDYLDLFIDITENPTTEFLVKQIIHYLQMLD